MVLYGFSKVLIWLGLRNYRVNSQPVYALRVVAYVDPYALGIEVYI